MANLDITFNDKPQELYIKVQQRLETAQQYRTIFKDQEILAFIWSEELKDEFFCELDKLINVLNASSEQLENQLKNEKSVITFDSLNSFIMFRSTDTTLNQLTEHIQLLKNIEPDINIEHGQPIIM